jgi:serine phosphatase RsbU (regulator of sigma subunit)
MAVMLGRDLVLSYVNPQAQEMLGNEEEMIGRRAAEVFPAGAELAADLRESVLVRAETLHVKEVPVGDRFWTFSCAPIEAPDGTTAGVLAVGQDTTQETTRSRQLEAQLADEHRISTQLQVSLMPERLPAIPGIDLASGFRPAGDGSEIGGDFYDVFEISDGCWMAVLGDVCGKGAEAAALTALARYTLRAAAIREGAEPAKLLAQLNTAILSQRSDMRFLSAICLFLDLDDGGAATARVCVAGHLPPLLVRASGAVERVEGGAGPVLGVWDEPELTEQKVRLEPGSRMVLYTDGVLDAHPSRELTEDGLAAILSRFGESDAAATVAGIEREVIGADEGRDDMAVLVIRVP